MRYPLVLASDIGTSSIRTAVFDGEGRELEWTEARRHNRIGSTSDGGLELDPEILLHNLLECMVESVERAGEASSQIRAVAICTVWHSMVGVGRDGRAVTPFILWADERASEEAEELKAILDEDAIHKRTGCPIHVSYLPAKILWFRKRFPDLYRNVAKWLSIGEYVILRILGNAVTSYSIASGTGLFSRFGLSWDDEILSAISLKKEQLPDLVDFDTPLRGVRDEFSGLPPTLRDAIWFPSLGDGACSNVGSGCTSISRETLSLGTSGAIRVMFGDEMEVDPPKGLWLYLLDRKRKVLGGAISNGGIVYKWLLDFLKVGTKEEVEREVMGLEPCGHGISVLPFLMGERSPVWNPRIKGTIYGIRLSTRPVELIRASLEAVAYGLASIHRMIDEVVHVDREIVATGGAIIASEAWRQIVSDVIGKRIGICAEREASMKGAAIMALEALGLKSAEEIEPDLVETIHPDPIRHRRYEDGMRMYLELMDLINERAKEGLG
jgi:gluconokinase